MEAPEKLKPCPFCGEDLARKEDHHGRWYAHNQEPGPCILSHMQLIDEDDYAKWNTRASTMPGELNAATGSIVGRDDYVADLEKENAALREAQRWIPVTERLPDTEGNYMTVRGSVGYDYWYKGDASWDDENYDPSGPKTSHWMPLPAPPTTDKGE